MVVIVKNVNVLEEWIYIVLNEMWFDCYSVVGKMVSDK